MGHRRVLAVECRLRETVALPSHTLCIGEVVAAHLPDEAPRPLVKHGGMHTRRSGPPHRRRRRRAAETRRHPPRRRHRSGRRGRAPWQVTLLPPDGPRSASALTPTPHGDLLADLPLPPAVPAHGLRVRVERGHATPGTATVSAPRPAPTTGAPR
ncbi:flavin reductase [Streptomyces thermocarboxydus]